MPRQPKQPFRNKEPWVAEVYRWFWMQRYSAEQAYETFQRLRRNPSTELARAAGFPADLPPHQTKRERHSLDTVKAAWAAWNREAAQAGTLPALWDFLSEPAQHQALVLAAIAAWQQLAGEPWPVTVAEARAMDQLFTAAPDLPPLMAATLAQQLARWEQLPADQRRARLTVVRDFLGFAPWRGEDQQRAYRAWYERHRSDAVLIGPDGTARYTVLLSATLHGCSAVQASIAVGQDAGSGVQDPPLATDQPR
ncbi:MAG: hypothetical protein RMJ05_11855 [Thermomicrobium sp.]|nr:hypothetical protein [Thermomicrobium sp.]MDW8007391.1 hypothetical protein [Thermomicrobium sp.]